MCASSWVIVADAQQAVQRAGELVAVQRRRLGVAERQIAVASAAANRTASMWPGQFIGLSANCCSSSVQSTRNMLSRYFSQWPELTPELHVVDQRRLHLVVAALSVLAPAQVLEHVPDRPSPSGARTASPASASVRWKRSSCAPSRRWSRLRASSSCCEVRVEILLRVERRAVDAGQLRLRSSRRASTRRRGGSA